ncbi:hypothetical protein [Azospirillum sp. TSO22-1]|uniref:hypothetical protein n=1 Tax=Azospirillum sp. TSO22-1 TaxID=716789 RepID=UPI0018EE8E54|nr:hypothetical protein [Azospirillum sp. TSO22-1]
MSETPPPKPGKVKSPDRQDRLAERLRDNLKKRKEQARAREAKDDDREAQD